MSGLVHIATDEADSSRSAHYYPGQGPHCLELHILHVSLSFYGDFDLVVAMLIGSPRYSTVLYIFRHIFVIRIVAAEYLYCSRSTPMPCILFNLVAKKTAIRMFVRSLLKFCLKPIQSVTIYLSD
jgi:hypothetical protein